MQQATQSSFEQVLEENKERIYRICRIYAVSPIQPEDLFQEITIHIWKAFDSFENKASINTWVYRIALNVCIRLKSKLAKSASKTYKLSAIKFEIAQQSVNGHEELKYAALKNCIQSLNDLDRSMVVLSLEGLPYKEIANITGLTENHIAVKMKRIRKKLLNCITHKLKQHE